MQQKGQDILRAKGILDVKGENRRLVFQAVHMILEGDLQREWTAGEKRVSRAVFIGRHLDEAALKAGPDVLAREMLERDLRYWMARRATAVLAPPPSGDAVQFGSRVTIVRKGREQRFRIVGVDEADPARGLISVHSPLATCWTRPHSWPSAGRASRCSRST